MIGRSQRGMYRWVTTLVTIAMLSLNFAVFGALPAAAVPPVSTQATFVDYAQCANTQAPSLDLDCGQGWINGILNPNNSHYGEDQVTPQRAEVVVPAGGPTTLRTLTFRYQARKGGIHAYDSLATWNFTQTAANRLTGL